MSQEMEESMDVQPEEEVDGISFANMENKITNDSDEEMSLLDDDLLEMADASEEEDLPVTSIDPHQTEMMERLEQEGDTPIKFSEIAAMMTGEADQSADEMTEDEAQAVQENKPTKKTNKKGVTPVKDSSKGAKKKSSRAYPVNRSYKLPPALSALMGQANLCYNNGEKEEAIKMCLAIIREFPNYFFPYNLLANIYEEKGLQTKALHYRLFAAHNANDPGIWLDIANEYESNCDYEESVYCYGRAIKIDPTNLSVHVKRLELLHKLDQVPKLLRYSIYLLKFLKHDNLEETQTFARYIAETHYKQSNYNGAKYAMESIFLRHPALITYDNVKIIIRSLVMMNNHLEVLVALEKYSNVKFLCESSSEGEWDRQSLKIKLPNVTSVTHPYDLPIDLRGKLSISLIKMEAFELALPLVQAIKTCSTTEHGDVFIELAEAYLQMKKPKLALEIIKILLLCPKNQTDSKVWSLHAEGIIEAYGATDDAIDAYYKVIEYSSDNASARLSLSKILQEKNVTDAALQVLTENSSPYNLQVLYQKCLLLDKLEMEELFLEDVNLLLAKHFVRIRSIEEANVLLNNKKASSKYEQLRELRESNRESVVDAEPTFSGPDVLVKDQWHLFVRACTILHQKKRYPSLERFTFSALGSREFTREYLHDMEFFCLQASMANNNSFFAFNLMRSIITRTPDKNRVWNLLSQVIMKADDFRHNRYLLRLYEKNTTCLALSMLNGHNCLVAGTYKYCLAEYMKVFKGQQNDPLASLMLGITYVHMACQKFSADKNALVTQAWVFLNSYRELRGDCQESFYNIGRAMQQLSINNQAIFYYEMALECPPVPQRPGYPSLDLTKEIAFNLSLLYKKNNINYSRYYIRKFITV